MRLSIALGLAAALASAAPARGQDGKASPQKADANGCDGSCCGAETRDVKPTLAFADAPKEWQPRAREKKSFLVDLDLPAAEGDAEAPRVNVLLYPMSFDDYRTKLLAHWKDAAEKKLDSFDAGPIAVRLFELSGSLDAKKDWALVSAHMSAAGVSWNAWLIGPKKGVAKHRDAYLAWLKTARVVSVHARDFASDEPGKAPAGFKTAVTGDGSAGAWLVRASGARRVLVQESADKTDRRYPLCVLDAPSARDASVAVAFRPVSGEVDRAGGLVLRYKDEKNYYLARANALEDNVRFYKVENGVRTQLASADRKVASGEWHALRLEATADRFAVWFDGERVIEVTDATFGDAGKVGLWTKADSVTEFADLAVSTPWSKE